MPTRPPAPVPPTTDTAAPATAAAPRLRRTKTLIAPRAVPRQPVREQPGPDAATGQLLAELADWVGEHGDAAVPQSGRSRLDLPGARPLGRRLSYLRDRHARGTLPADLACALQAHPGWSWTPQADTVTRHLHVIREHYATGAATQAGLPPDTRAWLRAATARGYTGLPDHAVRQLTALPASTRGQAMPRFLKAAAAWLAEHPDLGMADLRARDTTTLQGRPYALGQVARTYRARGNGDPTRPDLTAGERAQLEQLRGWRWSPRPRTTRTGTGSAPEPRISRPDASSATDSPSRT